MSLKYVATRLPCGVVSTFQENRENERLVIIFFLSITHLHITLYYTTDFRKDFSREGDEYERVHFNFKYKEV